jgi:hypothetical protein
MGMISKHNWGPPSYWSLCPFVPHHLFVFVIPSLVHCPTSMAYQLATWPSFITCTILYPIYHYLSIDDLDAYPLLASESKTSAEADINFDLLPTRRRWIFYAVELGSSTGKNLGVNPRFFRSNICILDLGYFTMNLPIMDHKWLVIHTRRIWPPKTVHVTRHSSLFLSVT